MESPPRVLFLGAPEFNRRLRMTARVITELRRRGWPFTAVAQGPLPEEMLRMAAPDEWHESVTDAELRRLMANSVVLLESADQKTEVSAQSGLAATIGLPVVTHRDSEAGAHRVDEWSADAFADAVVSLAKRS